MRSPIFRFQIYFILFIFFQFALQHPTSSAPKGKYDDLITQFHDYASEGSKEEVDFLSLFFVSNLGNQDLQIERCIDLPELICTFTTRDFKKGELISEFTSQTLIDYNNFALLFPQLVEFELKTLQELEWIEVFALYSMTDQTSLQFYRTILSLFNIYDTDEDFFLENIFFDKYLNSTPMDFPTYTPHFWAPKFQQSLYPSPILADINFDIWYYSKRYYTINDVLLSKYRSYFPEEKFTLQKWLQGVFFVRSRMGSDAHHAPSMLYFLQSFRHNPFSSTKVEIEEGKIIIRTGEDIRKHSEITVNYWDFIKFNFLHLSKDLYQQERLRFLESTNILRTYGYLPINNQDFTFVKIFITIDFDDPVVASFLSPFLSDVPFLHLDEKIAEITLEQKFPTELIFLTRILTLPFSEFSEEAVASIFAGQNIQLDIELRALSRAIELLERQLQLYPYSLSYLRDIVYSEVPFNFLQTSLFRLHIFEQKIIEHNINLIKEYWNNILFKS